MPQIHADGFENVLRIRNALLCQLLHFLELFRRRQAFRQRNASRRSQLYDGVLREVFAADADVAGPFIAHGVFIQIDRGKGQLTEPAEKITVGVDIAYGFARAHGKTHDRAFMQTHRACKRGNVAVVGNNDGHIADLLRGTVEDGLDLFAAAARHLEEDGGNHRRVADEHACG